MKKVICIVVALKKEAEKFIEKANLKENGYLAGKKIFYGNINGCDIVLALSGIGKVSASLTTQALIDKYQPQAIINFGSVGGIGNVSTKRYYVVDKCCQYDFDLSDLDNVSVGYIQDYDRVFFNTKTDNIDFLEKVALATSDRFTCKQHDIDTIKKLGCSIFDMEGCAIAQVCTSNDIPLYIVKGVTDIYGSGANSEQFLENLKAVGDGFADVIPKLIEKI